jgi:cold shock CspA family protein
MKYDVFISHASEDKADFVHALAQALDEKGLSVWYDEFTLHLGDSLTESINKGLSQSSFGIVILSQDFFRKKWPKRELSALIFREDAEEKVILPIWHNITKDEVLASFPLIADKFAVMSKEGMPTVIHKIFEVVKPDMIAEEHYKKGLMLEENKLPDEAMAEYFKTLQINHNHMDALRRIRSRIIKQKSPYVSETTIKIGTVKFYSRKKGFGFITGEDGKSYFAHISSIEEELTIYDGDRVAFLAKGDRGMQAALAVRII